MDTNSYDNLKRAEEALRKMERDTNQQEDKPMGEMAKLSGDSPLVAQLREQKLAWEVAQAEVAQRQKQAQEFKIKRAKRIEAQNTVKAKAEQEKKLKASMDALNKLNAEIDATQLSLGKLVKFIDSNEHLFNDQPYLRVKMQRAKRMLTAFYYGMKSAGIKPKGFDERY